jgi:hypothetical protein
VIPDPKTTVVGKVIDRSLNPVAGATVTTTGGLSGTTATDGSFSIADEPTVLGNIVVTASGLVNGSRLTGKSGGAPAVPSGVTNVGDIRLALNSVLIVAADYSSPQAQLLASGRFTKVDTFIAVSATPTLQTLSAYDVVLVYTNYQLANPTAVGNVLADYVDGGGRVVLGTYALSSYWGVAGRITTHGYSPLVNGGNGSVSGRIAPTTPVDSLFADINLGVVAYFWNSNFAHPGLDAGATLLATDGAGVNMIARSANGKVMGVNLFPANGYGNNQEYFKLWANILASF